MELPEDLLYSTEHEWVRVDGARAAVGITDFAQDSLGDVVYVALPQVGASVTAGAGCGEIESTKSVSDLYSPLSGTVVEVNGALAGAPDLLNSDPYGEGWIFAVDVSDPTEKDGLLSASEYRALTSDG